MVKKFQPWLMGRLRNRPFKTDDEIYLHLMSIVANIFALTVHLYFFLVFLASKVTVFAFINLFSTLFYIASFLFLKKRMYRAMGLSLALEVITYATVFGILAGAGTHPSVFYILIIGIQVLVPYWTIFPRVIMVLLCALAATISLIANSVLVPTVVFEPGLQSLVLASHEYVLIIGITVELCIVNIVKRIIEDMSSTKIDKLSSQAHLDPLTGLYNRRYAETFFGSLTKLERKQCVAMLDIDDFKKVNDTYGHACGDEVLVFLAAFLKSNLRKSDAVFRWGGEEFLLVISDADPESARLVLESLRIKLSETDIPTKKGALRITVTIGISGIDTGDIKGSIEKSDQGLYRGKRGGKNAVIIWNAPYL